MAPPNRNDVRAPIIASEVRVPVEDASFLRAVLEAIPAFVVRLDPEQRISYINHLRGGLTLGDVMGRPVHEFVAPEDLERYQHAVDQALRTGEICSYLVKGALAVRPQGAAHYEGQAVPIDHGDGRRAVCIVASDVSEHIARADALQESEEKLRLAVDATGIGLWTWNVVHDRTEWSSRMTEIAGCEPMPVREYITRLVHPGDRARVIAESAAPRTGPANLLEHRIIRPDGQVRWLLSCGSSITDEHGRVVRMIGGTLDVTAQRMTDEHLRKAQRLDAIGSLTAGVTHNFNNMLAVIVPNLELALRNASKQQTQMLGDALHAARGASELVARLMTFAGQRGSPAVEPHDLTPLVERAVSMCRRTFGRQVQIEAALERSCPRVACDPMAIEQVVVNLLINARDAVLEAERADACIQVDLSETLASQPAPGAQAERYARIRVLDNGVGMTDAVKQRLFEPFYTTKEAGKGTGLGLATSYGIVRDHGGFITFESRRGAGTVADVYLPLARGLPTHAPAARPIGVAGRGTILVVDDERAIRRLVALLLRERGHEVHLAADGAAAVAELDAGLRPSVILLDQSMPGWSARITIDEIRKRTVDVPIVFFTGQDVPSGERELVQGVLYKPLSAEELVQSVERWLVATI